MKKSKIKAKSLRNIHELRLLKQRLEYQEKLLEKELANSSAAILGNFTNSLRDISFRFGWQLVSRFSRSWKKRRRK